MGELGSTIGGAALGGVPGALVGNKVGGGSGGKKSAPAPPDFASLATQQTAANRPNQSNPFGSTTWDPTHQTQTTSFGAGLQPTADSLMGQFANANSTPLDNGESARKAATDSLYSQATSRLDPMWQQREQSTNAGLANQGLDPGSEAGARQLDVLGRARNDAYTSAENSAVAGGATAASQQQQLDLNSRAAPLQGLSGLRSLLGMPAYGQAGDLLGAGNMGYNAQLSNFNANGGSLGGYGQLLQALGPLIQAGGKAAAAGGG